MAESDTPASVEQETPQIVANAKLRELAKNLYDKMFLLGSSASDDQNEGNRQLMDDGPTHLLVKCNKELTFSPSERICLMCLSFHLATKHICQGSNSRWGSCPSPERIVWSPFAKLKKKKPSYKMFLLCCSFLCYSSSVSPLSTPLVCFTYSPKYFEKFYRKNER